MFFSLVDVISKHVFDWLNVAVPGISGQVGVAVVAGAFQNHGYIVRDVVTFCYVKFGVVAFVFLDRNKLDEY
jgi:hypothetical protein